jgi:hypothetical protein
MKNEESNLVSILEMKQTNFEIAKVIEKTFDLFPLIKK